MIEGTPGSHFEGEVAIRRKRYASEESGFAVVDAERDGDELVLVGPIAHLEERERVRIAGTWQDDRRFGMQVKVATAEPLPPSGDAALTAYLKRVKHVGAGPRGPAAAAPRRRACSRRSTTTRTARCARSASTRGARTRRSSRGTSCAPAARCTCMLAPHGLAWLVPRIAQAPRRARPPDRPPAPVRAHQRVRRRLPHRRHDRARRRHAARRRRRARARASSTCSPRPRRRARRASRWPSWRPARPRCSSGPPPDAALLGAMEDAGELVLDVDDGPRGLGVPAADRGARGRARRRSCARSRTPSRCCTAPKRLPEDDARARAGAVRGGRGRLHLAACRS